MIDVREVIAFFATHSVDPTKVYVFGGTELTPQDVAAAMSGLTPTGNYLLRAKYAEQDHHLLFSAWFIDLKKKWGREHMVKDVCQASLVEAVGTNVCPECNGVGEQQIGAKVHICGCCGGSGRWYEEFKFPKPWDDRLKWAGGALARLETISLDSVECKLLTHAI